MLQLAERTASRAALSAAQVSDLYYSDEGLPQPIALPADGWSGNYVQTRRVYGSSIGGGEAHAGQPAPPSTASPLVPSISDDD